MILKNLVHGIKYIEEYETNLQRHLIPQVSFAMKPENNVEIKMMTVENYKKKQFIIVDRHE